MPHPDRDALIASGIGLAKWLAMQGAPPAQVDDRCGVAFVALCRAADDYDPARAKFSTHAGNRIRSALAEARRRWLRDQGWRRRAGGWVHAYPCVALPDDMVAVEPDPEQQCARAELRRVFLAAARTERERQLASRHLDGDSLIECGHAVGLGEARVSQVLTAIRQRARDGVAYGR